VQDCENSVLSFLKISNIIMHEKLIKCQKELRQMAGWYKNSKTTFSMPAARPLFRINKLNSNHKDGDILHLRKSKCQYAKYDQKLRK